MKIVIAALGFSLCLAAHAQNAPAPISKQEFINAFIADSNSTPTDKEEAQFIALQDTIFFSCLGKAVPSQTQKTADTQIMLNACSSKLPERIDFAAPDIEQKMSSFDQCFSKETLKLLAISEEQLNQCDAQTNMDIPMDEKISKANNNEEKQALEALKVFISQ